MPIAPNVTLGSTVNADVYLYQDDGITPLITVGGVIFNVFAFNNLKVLSGIATQDFANPAHWTASISIPSNAPPTNAGQFYTLQWIANTSSGKYVEKYSFTVSITAAPPITDACVAAVQNQPFEVDLVLPYSSISSLSLRILNSCETPLVTMTGLNTTAVSQNGSQFIYRIPITDPSVLSTLAVTNNPSIPQGPNIIINPNIIGFNYGDPGFGVMPYIAYIQYLDPNGNQCTEIQPIYICSTMMIQLMKGMQNFIDILRNNDTIPQLRVTESKLIHFLIQGLLKFNSTPPQQIQFNFASLPTQFQFFVQKLGCLEFLQALMLGEGMTAFNFSGMSTQLDSDRTQYISNMIESIRGDDVVQMQISKRNFAKSGGGTGLIGSIGINLGPNFNFLFPLSYYNSSNLFGLPFIY
jgi:hypothetical protein